MAKPRTKRYNPHKQSNRETSKANAQFTATFSKIGIACNVLAVEKSGLYEEIPLPEIRKKDALHRMFKCKHNWTVYGAVCFKERNGKLKLKCAEMGAGFPVLFSEITASIADAHKEFLHQFTNQVNHICGFGFVAYITDEPKSDELIMAALEQVGCFDGQFKAVLDETNTVQFIEI